MSSVCYLYDFLHKISACLCLCLQFAVSLISYIRPVPISIHVFSVYAFLHKNSACFYPCLQFAVGMISYISACLSVSSLLFVWFLFCIRPACLYPCLQFTICMISYVGLALRLSEYCLTKPWVASLKKKKIKPSLVEMTSAVWWRVLCGEVRSARVFPYLGHGRSTDSPLGYILLSGEVCHSDVSWCRIVWTLAAEWLAFTPTFPVVASWSGYTPPSLSLVMRSLNALIESICCLFVCLKDCFECC